MTADGKELLRLRQDTPWHDYRACIDVIAAWRFQRRAQRRLGAGQPMVSPVPLVCRPGRGAAIWLS